MQREDGMKRVSSGMLQWTAEFSMSNETFDMLYMAYRDVPDSKINATLNSTSSFRLRHVNKNVNLI